MTNAYRAIAIVLPFTVLAACGSSKGSASASNGASPDDAGAGASDAPSTSSGDGVAPLGPAPATCGNNVTDPGEACDGTDLNGFASVDQLVAGYRSGALKCRADCLGYDISGGVPGKTVPAASCAQSDVQAAIDSAAHGDTILVPAGTCTWSVAVKLDATSRSLALQGAGATQTILDPAVDNALMILSSEGHTFAVSNLQVGPGRNGSISVAGSAKSWRIHHLAATAALGAFLDVRGDTYGVVDHVQFTGGSQEPFANVGDSDFTSWQRPLSFGTARAVFFEDNAPNFTGQHNDGAGYLAAPDRGGRVVVRHNTVTNFLEGGGGLSKYGGSIASMLQLEVYDNQVSIADTAGTWKEPGWTDLGILPGGTAVWFDNTYTIAPNVSLSAGLTLSVYRSSAAVAGVWGVCDGTPRKVCSNVDAHWKVLSGQGPSACVQDADCGTGSTCTWRFCSVSKTNLCASDGDCPSGEACSGYLDGPASTGGYPCFMQPGFGTQMQAAPVYAWHNVVSGSKNFKAGDVPFATKDSHLVEGRDFVNGTPRPGYVPYVYPHPLVQLGP
jgi:hypothetical protein